MILRLSLVLKTWSLPLLLPLLLALPATVQAQFRYLTNNGTITIRGYIGPSGAVTIPDTINGLPVASIASFAFQTNRNITSIAIGSNVTNIGSSVFPANTNLTAITVTTANSAYSDVGGVLFNKSQTTLIQFPGAKVELLTFLTAPLPLRPRHSKSAFA